MKLSAGEGFELPDLGGLVDGVAATPREPQRLSTVYLDTEDLRLARWGVSLRHRAGEGWTVKLPGEDAGGLLVRDELEFPGGARTPPAGAVDLVTAYVRRAPLRPQVRLRTLRRGTVLRDGEGRPVADVVDDAVSVVHGRRVVARFRELEAEATADTPPRLLDAVVARLRDAGAGAPDPMPKYLRAIGGPGVAPPEVVLPALPSSAFVGDVVTRAIASGVVRLIRHDAVVRLDDDPEGVHQARVATRRLRSDLRTFRAVLDPSWAAGLREELGWLGDRLGVARDADVLLARLRDRADTLPAASADGARRVLAALEEDRAQAHAAALRTLRSDRYHALLDRLVEAARAPALLADEADRPAARALPRLVHRAWRALDRSVGSLSDPPSDEELHGVRIRAKRCRYAAEACAPSLGKPARRLATAAKRLQDTLGELNDAVVAERRLRDWTAHTRSPAGAFAAGELAALERAAAAEARARWPKDSKRVGARAPDDP